jgi:hypothetical protein
VAVDGLVLTDHGQSAVADEQGPSDTATDPEVAAGVDPGNGGRVDQQRQQRQGSGDHEPGVIGADPPRCDRALAMSRPWSRYSARPMQSMSARAIGRPCLADHL